jgi:hypothetical protein
MCYDFDVLTCFSFPEYVKVDFVMTSVSLCAYVLESESHVMTDGQSASLSWCQAPIWGPRPDFCYCQTVAGLLMWGALSSEWTVCRLQLLLVLASAVILVS